MASPTMSSRSASGPQRSRRTRRAVLRSGHLVLLAALLTLLVSTSACGGRGDLVPQGLTFAGDAAQLRPVLDRLEEMTGSPASEAATRVTAAISGCSRVFGHCEMPAAGSPAAEDATGDDPGAGGCDLAGALRCAEDSDTPEWIDTLRGDAGWVFAASTEPGRWLVVRGTTAEDGSVTLDGEVYPAGIEGPISLVLPAAEPAGPPHLSDSTSLVHLRLRPDGGLNLARFIQGGDWGARLYRLQSKLFEGTALAGVWELAIYPPSPGERIPPIALALDIRDRDLAVEVMEKFLHDLMATWPARRNDFTLGGWSGACLSNVRVMPDLAPCYVATDDTLVIGWNAASLQAALANPPRGASAPGDPPWSSEGSEARFELSRMPPVDSLLAQASGTTPLPSSFYPWKRLDLRAHRGEDSYLFEADLVAP